MNDFNEQNNLLQNGSTEDITVENTPAQLPDGEKQEQNDSAEDTPIASSENRDKDTACDTEKENETDNDCSDETPDAAETSNTSEQSDTEDASRSTGECAPTYYWQYEAQQQHDVANKKKSSGKKGILTYAIIMTAVFAVSFALLIAVLFSTSFFEMFAFSSNGEELSDRSVAVNIADAKYSVVLIQVVTETGSGSGSGVVYSEDGYIITNHHVIDKSTKILVTFENGDKAYAEVVGSSEMDDLAVIKVSVNDLSEPPTPAPFANYNSCYVGQTVFAIGAPAGEEFAWTVTKGIISYKNREVKKYNADGTLSKKLRTLQTDANVNPGNSGGPLVNEYGQVVGIVSMKLVGDYEGMGFAIPSDGVVEIVEAIIRDGNADSVNSSLSFKRPVLGIVGFTVEKGHTYVMDETEGRIYDVTEGLSQYSRDEVWNSIVVSGGSPTGPLTASESGVYVSTVNEGTGADGVLQVGDIITLVNMTEVTDMNVLMNELNKLYVGDTVVLKVIRDGEIHSVTLVLSAMKSE